MFHIGKLLTLCNTLINFQATALSLTSLCRTKVVMSNTQVQCSHTHVKNKAAEQKKNPVSVTEALLQQEENHICPGKYIFKEFWTYFLIPIKGIFLKI